MKRCPQCEFIYEEDQQLCDMDGQLLVHDLAFSKATSTALPTGKSRLKSLIVPAATGLVLAGILSTTYFAVLSFNSVGASPVTVEPNPRRFDINRSLPSFEVSTLAAAGSASAIRSPLVTPSVEQPDASVETGDDEHLNKIARAHVSRIDDRLAIPRYVPPLPRVKPLPRLGEAKPLATHPKPKPQSNPPAAKESKVTSFLKRTGKAIVKPFKR